MKFSYNWLQSYFKKPLPPPKEIAEWLIRHAFEVEAIETVATDCLFEIKILPDRFADAANHYGLAREIAAIFEYQILEIKPPHHEGLPTKLSVKMESKNCRRYVSRRIGKIKIGPSPEWLSRSLESIGLRSINNIVDATNFVMASIGQPLHAFDADKISEKIIVREAEKGEKISLLAEGGKEGEREIVLSGGELLIADAVSGLALAGVKGGRRAEINEKTKNIILESANFNPVAVGRVSRKLGILTDSSRRFENNLSPELASFAMDLVSDLILNIAGGEAEQVIDIYEEKQKTQKIILALEKINNLLGTILKAGEISRILQRLHFEFEEKEETFTVTPPFYRQDLLLPEDVIEEIGRIYGYDKIPEKLPASTPVFPDKDFYFATKMRHILRDLGFSEIYTYSLVEKGEVALKNPLAADKKFLRADLVGGMKKALDQNKDYLPLLGVDELFIFEMGRVFEKNNERNKICLAAPIKKMDDLMKEIEKRFGVNFKPEQKNTFGKFTIWEFDFDGLIEPLPLPKDYNELSLASLPEVKFKNISPFPFIARDIAVWLPACENPEKLFEILSYEGGSLLARSPRLFDTFEKDGRKSYAYRLVFESPERTLTDGEVNGIMTRIEQKIKEFGWQVR